MQERPPRHKLPPAHRAPLPSVGGVSTTPQATRPKRARESSPPLDDLSRLQRLEDLEAQGLLAPSKHAELTSLHARFQPSVAEVHAAQETLHERAIIRRANLGVQYPPAVLQAWEDAEATLAAAGVQPDIGHAPHVDAVVVSDDDQDDEPEFRIHADEADEALYRLRREAARHESRNRADTTTAARSAAHAQALREARESHLQRVEEIEREHSASSRAEAAIRGATSATGVVDASRLRALAGFSPATTAKLEQGTEFISFPTLLREVHGGAATPKQKLTRVDGSLTVLDTREDRGFKPMSVEHHALVEGLWFELMRSCHSRDPAALSQLQVLHAHLRNLQSRYAQSHADGYQRYLHHLRVNMCHARAMAKAAGTRARLDWGQLDNDLMFSIFSNATPASCIHCGSRDHATGDHPPAGNGKRNNPAAAAGAAVKPRADAATGGNPAADTACNRFNTKPARGKKACTYGAKCIFAHRCTKCHQDGHGRYECPSAPSG